MSITTTPGRILRNTDEGWQIDAGLCAGKGRVRKLQEDAWYFGDEKNDPAGKNFARGHLCRTTDSGGCLFAVFDGIGEGKRGKEAARTAANWIKYISRLSDRGQDLCNMLPEWSVFLNRKIRRDFPGAGTTMAMAFFSGRTVQIAHIGDSRVYRLQAGNFEQLTRDHTHAELMYRHRILTREEAQVHPSRHILSRYFGMENELIGSAVEITPAYPLQDRDRYILCTDGIYEMLPEEAIKVLCSGGGSAVNCADLLYRQAMAEGGRDNLTVIVCEVQKQTGDYSIRNILTSLG